MILTIPKGTMDISNSPVIIASIISVISGFVLTQVIGPLLEHYRDKSYRVLERNLQLRKLMGDDFKNESLDEIIRMQLNSYILVSRTTERRSKKHRRIISLVSFLGWVALGITVIAFSEHAYGTAIFTGILAVLCVLGTIALKQKFYRSYTVENTKYKAVLLGGKYEGGYVSIDIMPANEDGSLSSLDYPVLYIRDKIKGRIHVYSRVKSAGNISIGSGEETSMQTDYAYETVITSLPENTSSPSVVYASDLKLPGEMMPIEDIALASVKPMRKVWSILQRLFTKISQRSKGASTPE